MRHHGKFRIALNDDGTVDLVLCALNLNPDHVHLMFKEAMADAITTRIWDAREALEK